MFNYDIERISLITDSKIESLLNIDYLEKQPVVEEYYQDLYAAEMQTEAIFRVFSYLTAIIAILGLLGLVSFTVQQRTKELCIRKVLGATNNQLLASMNKGFLILVLVSLLISSPLVYYLMDNWLASFSYRISIPITVFIVSSSLAICFAVMVISLQSLRTVKMNPSKNLRRE